MLSNLEQRLREVCREQSVADLANAEFRVQATWY